VIDAIAVGRSPFAIATGNGCVWVANAADDTVSRIDPLTDTVVASIPVGLLPIGIAVTPGAVWIANHHGNPATSVSRIDPATNTVVATITSPSWPQYFGGPSHIAAGAGSIWVDVNEAHAVARIDPATNAITAMIAVKGVAGGIAASGTGVWVAGGFDYPGVTRIDPLANAVVDNKINAGGLTAGVALAFGSLWFATPQTNFLDRAELTSDTVTGQLRLAGAFPTSVATGFDAVWVADPQNGLLLRVQPD
jgi:YVTN family beta-propeller protein